MVNICIVLNLWRRVAALKAVSSKKINKKMLSSITCTSSSPLAWSIIFWLSLSKKIQIELIHVNYYGKRAVCLTSPNLTEANKSLLVSHNSSMSMIRRAWKPSTRLKNVISCCDLVSIPWIVQQRSSQLFDQVFK